MQLAMVGLGRMGANLVRRLMRAGHECVVHDRDDAAVDALAAEGARPARGLQELVACLRAPRAVWVMLPHGAPPSRPSRIGEHLAPGDVVIDGGNSHHNDDVRRARELAQRGIDYLDIGTSGGVWGLQRGYCLMIGGSATSVQRLAPLFEALAPGVAMQPRTPTREGEAGNVEHGWLHCGPAGAGHFVKMIHNGIEYGMMQALAEGFDILRNADKSSFGADHSTASTSPTSPKCGAAAAWCRRGCSTLQRGAGPGSATVGLHRRGRGFGRGTLDGAGRGRRGGAGRSADRSTLCALPVATGPHLRREDAVGAATAVRRTRRAAQSLTSRDGFVPKGSSSQSSYDWGCPLVHRQARCEPFFDGDDKTCRFPRCSRARCWALR